MGDSTTRPEDDVPRDYSKMAPADGQEKLIWMLPSTINRTSACGPHTQDLAPGLSCLTSEPRYRPGIVPGTNILYVGAIGLRFEPTDYSGLQHSMFTTRLEYDTPPGASPQGAVRAQSAKLIRIAVTVRPVASGW